jgi:hypothetical protein
MDRSKNISTWMLTYMIRMMSWKCCMMMGKRKKRSWDAYMMRTLIERLHDDGQEEEQWLSKKRFENFCIMRPIYLCFWASGEMILTTSTLR